VTIYFLDSSAIVKRYVRELGSNWIRQIINYAQLSDPIFLTADKRLLAIAQSAGLPCDDPNQYS
jgi:predicted nucleic acid-binding protein